MTACVDNNTKKGGAKKAVSATLAGVLAVGMVPAVALAADEAPEAEEGGVELLAEDAATAFSNGTVAYQIGEESYDSTKAAEIEWTGNELDPENVTVTPRGGSAINIASPASPDKADNYKVYFVTADAEGEPTTEKVAEPTEAGNYFLAIEAVGGTYEGGIAYAEVNIVGKSLESAVAFNTSDEDEGTAFTYDAEAQTIGFKIGEDELVEGKDYTVKYYKAGEDYNNAAAGSETAPTNAGTYYARLKGMGAYAGRTQNVQFQVAKANLKTADYYVEQVVGATTAMPTAPAKVNGSTALAAQVKLTYTETEVGGLGKYTATVSPVTKDDPNFEETGTVDVVKVAREATITYDDAAFPETLTINKGAKEAFDAKLIEVVDDEVEDVPYTVEYKKIVEGQEPETVNVDALANPGTYTVTVKVTTDDKYQLGGSAQMTVTVIKGIIDCDTNLFVTYDGKIVTSVEAEYDAAVNLADEIEVALYESTKADDPLESGYEVTFYDADGEKTDTVTDAGSYTMEITSDVYTIENGTVDITIAPMEIESIKVADLAPINGRYALAYNDGKAIEHVVQYTTGERDSEGDLVWAEYADSAVDANSELTYTLNGEAVDEVADLGNYTLTIAAAEVDTAKNYEFTAEPFEFTVAQALAFVDVPTSEWYYEYVEAVTKAPAGYMFGYENTHFFGPNDAIKRGDVCMVLARMAGLSLAADSANQTDQTYSTPFSDVDGSAYYAQAIAWAANMGIVTGDDGATTFRPEDSISRQEFATMLYRYAQKAGTDVSADVAAELAKYDDGDLVADFADEAIAWLSSEGIMTGHAGTSVMDPTAPVTRAQVAKMTTEYQPAKLTGLN